MQRQLPRWIVLLGLMLSFSARAQAQDPVAAAAREEAAERYRTLSSKVSRLEEDLHSYQSRVMKLSEENFKLREEIDRLKSRNESAATLEKIGKLQDAIKQVDEARQEDNKRVLAEITRRFGAVEQLVAKAVKGAAAPPPVSDEPRHETSTTRPPTTKGPPGDSYQYTVKRGDTLSGIAAGLKAQGYKVSAKQIEDANPNVNWSRLPVGKEIIIPPPSP